MEPALEIEPGDLARRITHRRQELRLTMEDLALQADVDPGFLEYFEGHTDVQLGRGALSAIARVLQTSPASLLGGDRNRPLGGASALPGAILEPLTSAQCRAHLGVGGVGRVIFHASRGPVAFPVNYRFSNNEVLFNTTVKAARELESQALVGFEIDRIDDVFSEGWSVIVTGSARQVIGIALRPTGPTGGKLKMPSPEDSSKFEQEEPEGSWTRVNDREALCSRCWKPTYRVSRYVNEGSFGSGPYAVERPLCEPCDLALAEEAEAYAAAHEAWERSHFKTDAEYEQFVRDMEAAAVEVESCSPSRNNTPTPATAPVSPLPPPKGHPMNIPVELVGQHWTRHSLNPDPNTPAAPFGPWTLDGRSPTIEELEAAVPALQDQDDPWYDGPVVHCWVENGTEHVQIVDHPDQLVEHAAHGARPWAGGARGAVVAITVAEVTGRSILHDGTDKRTAGRNS